MVEFDKIKEIVFGKTPQWVINARKDSKVANVHVNGVGTSEYLKHMQKFENKEQFDARKQLVTSNRFLFSNLTRPIDKVFQASGGSRVYPKKNEKKISETCDNIRHGYSVKQWIKNVQANKYYTDPSGVTFMEWDENTTYPTIKSIESIKNYESDGRLCNWICFEPFQKDDKKYVRFVDDVYDYLFRIEQQTLIPELEETYKNPFGKCPAIINSDIMHFDLERHDSPLAPLFELSDHYLRTGSVKNIYENYHGYPIFWMYGMPCKRCKGSGTINNGEEVIKCPSCSGTGTTAKKDVTDIVLLKPPVDSDTPKIAPDIAGYVQPDLQTWKEQRTELDWLWQLQHFTLWGTSYERDQETATATFIDAQPVNDRLFLFSEANEDLDQKITEFVALFYNSSADGVSVNWGKRFQLERPDAIWKRYIEAKEKGANKTTLDYLLKSFYQTEYANDVEMLVTSMKMLRLEPFVHLTEQEVKNLGISGQDLLMKFYFNEWISSLESGYIYVTDFNKLKNNFMDYVSEKQLAENNPSIN